MFLKNPELARKEIKKKLWTEDENTSRYKDQSKNPRKESKWHLNMKARSASKSQFGTFGVLNSTFGVLNGTLKVPNCTLLGLGPTGFG